MMHRIAMLGGAFWIHRTVLRGSSTGYQSHLWRQNEED